MPRAVVLRHDLPDGSHHFDWLFERGPGDDPADDPDAPVLIAWRLPVTPDEAGGVHEAVRLAPHRRVYLSFEGALSGGRGVVARVASGRCEILTDRPERFEAAARYGPIEILLEGEPAAPPIWTLRLRRR